MAERVSRLIEGKADLIESLARGCKPREKWRIGTEHEKFTYRLSDYRPLAYEGEDGIRRVLENLERFGWQPVLENGNPIALEMKGEGSISLEPAGQLELSGAQLETVHQTCDEVNVHLSQCKIVAAEMGLGLMGLGYNPKWPISATHWMPKARYRIMRDYMPTRGNLGLEMMLNSCTIQVNLDFDQESTMVQMFRVALALQPIATALFANSPFKEGKPSGYLSYRSHIWTDVDPDRCGILPFVFEDGFGFERYVDYMLDVPMYFVIRNKQYINAAGQSFRQFLDGRLPALPGEKPTVEDWENHLTVVFPEARLKNYLEMRGADGGPWARICALSAFWVGLMYDSEALNAAAEMVSDWTIEEHAYLRQEAPRLALRTPFRDRTVREIARKALNLSRDGLYRRNRLNMVGVNETYFLNDLFQIVESGMTPAEELLCAYEGRWNGNVDPVFTEYAY